MKAELGALNLMMPISLGEMESIRLMNRVDTKYLTDTGTLGVILELAAQQGYKAFEEASCKLLDYRTLYYDTPDLRMYLDHHNRRLTRQKLRARCYTSSGVTFLELKSKNNHGRTKKKRMEIDKSLYCQQRLSNQKELEWLEGRLNYPADNLSPALETLFTRITLVNPEMTERSTIDFDLSFRNARTEQTACLGSAVIIEVKQDGNLPSRMRDILLEKRVKPFRLSKYCIGTALTDPMVKQGRFKSKIRQIEKYI